VIVENVELEQENKESSENDEIIEDIINRSPIKVSIPNKALNEFVAGLTL
jgi:hypothetical protein